jgi:hypothetical protein
MEHRDRYYQLLSPDFRGRVLEAIRAQGYLDVLKVHKARIVDADPFAYVLLNVEADSTFVARGGGLCLSLDGLVEPPPPERYYLPYIGLTPKATQVDLEHELERLHDLLELIRLEPSYPTDAVQLGVENIEDPTLIPRSVRFEVRKLFLLEAPVFGREFDSGSCTIDVPFLLGRTLKYRCETRKEYVSLWMATYLQAFRGFFFQRFPEHAAQIDANLSEATDEFGASIFGDDASKSIASTFDTLPARILAQFLGD